MLRKNTVRLFCFTFALPGLFTKMFLLVRIDCENRMMVIHSSWMMRNNWALVAPYRSMEELRSLVDQNKPLPNDTPAYQVTSVHLNASLEEAWSHIRTVDLDESMQTVPMVAQSSSQKVFGTIINPTSSTSSKTTIPSLVDTDTDKSIGQTALLHRLNQDVRLLLLKVDMLEKLMRSKSGVDRSPNDDTKSLACLPFMAPCRTLTDFDTGEVILTSEEKRKTAVLPTYTSLTSSTDALSLQIRRNNSVESASKFSHVCLLTISPKSSAGRTNAIKDDK
ncbi:hypothetical protein PHET_12357 [Paragonimus heterotremus]|uniref:Uncharacterized protein n=1 Tax=Paragonimus heterotremus TaxID=100268 RepID=A0A8J4SIA7_9TREM|nr:hypothetical protein PHET_12357 [Paragonimus heterotremus]